MPQDCPATDRLDAWLHDAAPGAEAGAVQAHVEACAACQAAVERLLSYGGATREGGQPLPEAGADFLRRLAERRPPPPPSPTLPSGGGAAPGCPPGYEFLGHLGSGGMGVVYKALQVRLNRVVALKMVLGGDHADPAQRVRFLMEAEAIARVRHPGIVQVHDLGTHEGLPFLALEFCAGGSLAARLNGTPLPPRQAVALMERVARAVQAAHEAGIVHRDLKPANVLLAEDGSPRVADFGLARRMEAGGGLTQTGAVMGTPSYMPPEQARGQKDVGPAADVYALGAILYECLTGRPPFRGATPIDTLAQVVADDPVPPSRLNPSASRDEETICLKCLQKEPRQRYASAGALADDLLRCSEGRPILARPISAAERAWRWARRYPALAGTLAAVAALLVTLAVGSAVAASLFRDQRDRAVEAEGRADDARREAEALLVKSLGAVAGEVRGMRLRGEMGAYFQGMPRLREALAKARELGAPEEAVRAIRDEMGNLLTVGDVEPATEWDGYPPGYDSVVFSPRLEKYTRTGLDGVVTVHQAGTGRQLSRLPGTPRPSFFRNFSRDGGLALPGDAGRAGAVLEGDGPRGRASVAGPRE